MSSKAEAALASIKGTVLSKGPNGEDPSPASSADLSADEIAKVKGMKAKAAIVMHYGGNDWANAQVAGLKSEFGKLGIDVVAVTDANFKPDKQVSDLETVLNLKPDIIVSIPTDPVATASAYKKAAAAGAKLVFMDNVPQGMKAGTDYVSVVSADNYGNGVISAHLMAKAMGGKGEIGLVFHEADFFVTKQRYDGFKSTITKDYPDIKIVEEKGIAGPDFAGDAQRCCQRNAEQAPHPRRHLGRLGRSRRGSHGRSPCVRSNGPEDRHGGPGQERRHRPGEEPARGRPGRAGALRPRRHGGPIWAPARCWARRRRPTWLSALCRSTTRTSSKPGSRSTTRRPRPT